MKFFIIFTLFLGLTSSILLHSQAVKVTDNKEIQIGKGDPVISPLMNPGLPADIFSSDVHTLTFGEGSMAGGIVKLK